MLYYLPILIIVLANITYHVSAKSVPKEMDSFFFLSLLYIISAVISFVIYFFRAGAGFTDVPNQAKFINWVPFLFAFGIVGLELGNILMYRVGWNISLGSLVSNMLLGIALIVLGYFVYKETFSMKQVLGVVCCMVGLVLINNK
ncbi:EamA family transporter [Clostridium grantii]|uniref:EamA-like transporter family protein n=1 Tax=Clostridium grantii DSM 8605 TaxID=1121316 RepID=A0A1M5TS18_9CLOT|nr:EamA family transporter [Clostridium grantii]SHH53193.1 EamA-like transporter family protein [Clostridium grantii DSM 8605]